jgi:hypothetical protein
MLVGGLFPAAPILVVVGSAVVRRVVRRGLAPDAGTVASGSDADRARVAHFVEFGDLCRLIGAYSFELQEVGPAAFRTVGEPDFELSGEGLEPSPISPR